MNTIKYFEEIVQYLTNACDKIIERNTNEHMSLYDILKKDQSISLYNSAKEFLRNQIKEEEIETNSEVSFNNIWDSVILITLDYKRQLNKRTISSNMRTIQKIIGSGYINETFTNNNIDRWWSWPETIGNNFVQIGLMPDNSKRLNYLIFKYENLITALPSIMHTIKLIEQLTNITGYEISFTN